MKMKKLSLKNFRGFNRLEIDFDNKVNVLIGVNGSGKSSVLDSIAVLLSRVSAAVISSKASGRQFSESDIENKSSVTNNAITVHFHGKDYQWNIAKTRQGKLQQESSSLHDARVIAETIQRQLSNEPDASIPLLVYYPVNRAVLDIPLRIKGKHVFDQIAAYDGALIGVENNFHIFFEWFRNREDIENEQFRKSHEDGLFSDEKSDLDFQLEAVRSAIIHFMPEFKKPRIKRQPLRMTIEKNGYELIINQLSDGEKCALAMVGDLARRLAIANPGLSDPLGGEGVVLIDEVDLHMHPAWQRRVVPILTATFPNCQFILSTHSPQVVSEVRSESIWMLSLQEPEAVQPTGAYGLDSNRILEDVMNVSDRPEVIKNRIHELFLAIDRNELQNAKDSLKQIHTDIGDDPELTKAMVLIRRKEIIGK